LCPVRRLSMLHFLLLLNPHHCQQSGRHCRPRQIAFALRFYGSCPCLPSCNVLVFTQRGGNPVFTCIIAVWRHGIPGCPFFIGIIRFQLSCQACCLLIAALAGLLCQVVWLPVAWRHVSNTLSFIQVVLPPNAPAFGTGVNLCGVTAGSSFLLRLLAHRSVDPRCLFFFSIPSGGSSTKLLHKKMVCWLVIKSGFVVTQSG
jgi:hypothetical protein